jgi:hypothetical protein
MLIELGRSAIGIVLFYFLFKYEILQTLHSWVNEILNPPRPFTLGPMGEPSPEAWARFWRSLDYARILRDIDHLDRITENVEISIEAYNAFHAKHAHVIWPVLLDNASVEIFSARELPGLAQDNSVTVYDYVNINGSQAEGLWYAMILSCIWIFNVY